MGVVLFLVVVLFGFFALKGYLKGKATSTYARFKTAETATARSLLEGAVEYPSWIAQNAFANQLAREIVKDAVKSGLTESEAQEWFSRPSIRGSIVTMAANLERQGFSVSEQIAGAAQLAEKLVAIELRSASSVHIEEATPTTPVGGDDAVEDDDLLMDMLHEGLAENRVVHRRAVPFTEVEAFYDLFGCDVPTLLVREDGYRAGGGLVEFRFEGKCLVWFALTRHDTFMMAQRTPIVEVTPDQKPDLVAALEEGLAQWIGAVPGLESQARQLIGTPEDGSAPPLCQ